MNPIPLFVELCAGLAAVSVALQGGRDARPPVSRMGNKRGYAEAILWACGLRQGQGAQRFLWCEPDPGCAAMLRAYGRPEVLRRAAEIIRGWADEDPRRLWERLKAEGPIRNDSAGEVARWAQVQSANELIPLTGALENAGQGGSTCADPAHGFHTTADKLARRIDNRALGFPAVAVTSDARDIDPRDLPAGSVVFIDPPYVNTTGYGHDLPRADVVAMARRWRGAGALVCISEQEPIPELVADGWHTLDITDTRRGQKRTFSKQQAEWLTMSAVPKWRGIKQPGLFSDEGTE